MARSILAFHPLPLLAAGIALLGVACGGGSGGGSEGPSSGGGAEPQEEAPLATEPILLPLGQLSARITWPASKGDVSGYLVFVDRNESGFGFVQQVASPPTEIPGSPGDEIRVAIIATSSEGEFSPTSPPSPPIRFALDPNAPPVEPPVEEPPIEPPPADDPPADPPPDAPPVEPPVVEPPAEEPPVETPPVPEQPAPPLLDEALKTRLLLADLRAPLVGWGPVGSAWIRAVVLRELAIEAMPIATLARPLEALRDLVWLGDDGTLFVADGMRFAASEDEAATLEPAFVLAPEHRLIDGLDLDGDGLRDWLIENEATAELWRRAGATAELTPARPPALASGLRIRGVATVDLDGDGDIEGGTDRDALAALVWADETGPLALTRATDGSPLLGPEAVAPTGQRLVALADVTGDGVDELIARDATGVFAIGSLGVNAASGSDPVAQPPLALAWTFHASPVDSGAELLATTDLDGDARAELVFVTADGLLLAWGVGESEARPL